MATTLHRAVQNLGWRVSLIAPTHQSVSTHSFREIDPWRLSPEDVPGLCRAYWVTYLGSMGDGEGEGKPHGLTDGYERWAYHFVELVVNYGVGPSGLRHRDATEMVCQDRHDIATALRNRDNEVGYDDDNPTAQTLINGRYRESDELERDADLLLWRLRMRYRFLLREVE